jgi:ABC-2 type transport system ATP-binding protein
VAPQEIALYGHLSIRENLDVFAALAGVTRAERAQAALSAMIDAACLERQDQRVDRLSGGWRRRANLAAAIVHRPHLLILDEPTEGLDAEMKGALRVLIDTLRERRTAVLLISHDSEDVAALADRVGVLDRGRLVAEGSARALMAEAFGQRREISVRLAAPCDAALGALRLFGLKASPGGTDFSALVDDASSLAPRIDRALRAAGAPACELSVRSPGLEALIAWAADRPAA